MEFRILGALEVEEDGRTLAPGGRRARGLLAALLVHANEPVSADRLIEEVWRDELPENASKSLQIQISRLRKTLGNERLVTAGAGYRLVVREGELDSERAAGLVKAGTELLEGGEHAAAAESFADALALFRGRPLEEFTDDEFARTEAARLEELRALAAEGAVETELAQGRGDQVIGELQRLVAGNPFRERARGQLMVALYQAGRQADALAAYTEARRAFLYELGLEVGPELRELERRILNHDPALGPRRPRSVFARHPRRAAAIVFAIVIAVAVAVAGWASDGNHVLPPRALAELDPRTLRVTGITSLAGAPGDVEVGHRSVFVALPRGRTVLVVDPRTGATAAVRTPLAPARLAASDRGIWLLEPRTRRVALLGSDIVHRAPGGAPALDALVSEETTVWLAEQDSESVLRLDARSGRIEIVDNHGADSFFEGGARRAAAVGAGSLWVSNPVTKFAATDRLGRVSRIDLESGEVTARIRVPAPPSAIAADAGAVWVGLERGRDLWRIDPRDDVAAAAVEVGGPVADLAIAEGAVWVLETDGTLSRIDSTTNRVTGRAALGPATAIAVGHGSVWVATR